MVEYAGQRFLFTAGPKLGSGGMADVYLGTVSNNPDHHVALKVPLPILDHQVKEAFLREAAADGTGTF